MKAKNLQVHSAARYTIRVQGVLDAAWSDRLGGLEITCEGDSDDEGHVTTLRGQLMDQAALFGILNTLYGLRLPLLSVEYMAFA